MLFFSKDRPSKQHKLPNFLLPRLLCSSGSLLASGLEVVPGNFLLRDEVFFAAPTRDGFRPKVGENVLQKDLLVRGREVRATLDRTSRLLSYSKSFLLKLLSGEIINLLAFTLALRCFQKLHQEERGKFGIREK